MGLQRPLSSSAIRLQEADAKPVETKKPSAPVKRLKEYDRNSDTHLLSNIVLTQGLSNLFVSS